MNDSQTQIIQILLKNNLKHKVILLSHLFTLSSPEWNTVLPDSLLCGQFS